MAYSCFGTITSRFCLTGFVVCILCTQPACHCEPTNQAAVALTHRQHCIMLLVCIHAHELKSRLPAAVQRRLCITLGCSIAPCYPIPSQSSATPGAGPKPTHTNQPPPLSARTRMFDVYPATRYFTSAPFAPLPANRIGAELGPPPSCRRHHSSITHQGARGRRARRR